MTGELAPVRVLDDPDRARRLVAAFLAGRRSEHTRRAYARDLAAWLGWVRSHGLDPLDVRHAHTQLWLADLKNAEESDATRARRLAAVASWYRWLIREDVTTRNPANLDAAERPVVDRDHSRTPVLSGAEADRLCQAADTDPNPRTAVIVWLLRYCGLRAGELVALDVESIGLDRGATVLHVLGKGRRRRTVPLPPALFARVDRYLSGRPDTSRLPALTAGSRPRRPLLVTTRGARMHVSEVARTLRRVARVAALPELAERMSPHSLRHGFATDALDLGLDVTAVQDALGHADPRTTRRYDRRDLAPEAHPTYRLLAGRSPRTVDPAP